MKDSTFKMFIGLIVLTPITGFGLCAYWALRIHNASQAEYVLPILDGGTTESWHLYIHPSSEEGPLLTCDQPDEHGIQCRVNEGVRLGVKNPGNWIDVEWQWMIFVAGDGGFGIELKKGGIWE